MPPSLVSIGLVVGSVEIREHLVAIAMPTIFFVTAAAAVVAPPVTAAIASAGVFVLVAGGWRAAVRLGRRWCAGLLRRPPGWRVALRHQAEALVTQERAADRVVLRDDPSSGHGWMASSFRPHAREKRLFLVGLQSVHFL